MAWIWNIDVFFVFCILSMFLWHFIVKSIGKKKSWALYSLMSIVTFSLFLICYEGSFTLLIVLSILNSVPAGGAYLNDVFVSDIIDYDEFITGQRNEGLYTVFSTFIPKIVSIFAQSIPLTILGIIGFVSSKNGENMEQPRLIAEFVKFYFIGVPIILAILSFYYKLNYPIEDENKMKLLRETIQLQKEKAGEMKERLDFYKIKDPILSNYNYQLFCKNLNHFETKAVSDHFNNLEYLYLLYQGNYEELKKKLLLTVIVCLCVCVFCLFVLFNTFSYLLIKSFSFIPILSILLLSVFVVLLILNLLRIKIINKVITGQITIDKCFMKLIILAFKATINQDQNNYLKFN